MGTDRNAIVGVTKKVNSSSAISWDEYGRVVVVVLDVPVKRGQAVLLREFPTPGLRLNGKHGRQGQQEGSAHVDGLYAHFTSWLRSGDCVGDLARASRTCSVADRHQ